LIIIIILDRIKQEKKEPWRAPSDNTLFTFECFAVCFFSANGFFGAVESNKDGISTTFVLFCPVCAGVYFANNVFCHEGSPPLIVIDNIFNELLCSSRWSLSEQTVPYPHSKWIEGIWCFLYG